MDHWLARAAAMRPDRIALQTADMELTYAELLAAAAVTAGAMRQSGVAAGDEVGIALPGGAGFAATLHGSLLAGAVAVPLDLRLMPEERARRGAGVKLLVEQALDGPALREPESLRLDATATLMHTSGTTSEPQRIPLTYGNWLASALGSAVALGLDHDERWLCPMPLAHVGGLSILIRSAIYATTVVLHRGFDTEAVLSALMREDERVTLVSLVPTMLARLLNAGLRRPPTLRRALLGGGPIPSALLERARDADVPVVPSYGMTEACSQIATDGWPLPGVELRLRDDGEVLVRGATVSPIARAADGWLHSGDLGALDERGRLSIIGRKADTIVSGGENVAPAEVEAVLVEHPAVADAAVHARPDAEWGEAVVATVVLIAGASAEEEELRAFTASRLAAFKVPKAVSFTDELPRTTSGKLLRRQLD